MKKIQKAIHPDDAAHYQSMGQVCDCVPLFRNRIFSNAYSWSDYDRF